MIVRQVRSGTGADFQDATGYICKQLFLIVVSQLIVTIGTVIQQPGIEPRENAGVM